METLSEEFNLDYILQLRFSSEIVSNVNTYLNRKSGYGENFNCLNQQQRVFLLIGNLEKEINHGGFKHFYYSDAGNKSHETIIALKKIGASTTFSILQKANDTFPDGKVPKNKKDRFEIIQEMTTEVLTIWSECDEKFFMYEFNFEELLVKYLKNNIESFER